MNIERKAYLEHIRKFYDSNLIKVLTGVRRCGKSVLLSQIKNEIENRKDVDSGHIIFINFEDIAFSRLNDYEKLNAYILEKIIDDRKYYIFLDEIQHVRQFEKVLSSLKASHNVSVFVTGSNSKLLSGRLASLLVGRCKEFKIMPFSYSEYLQFHESNSIPLPKKPLVDYLRYGGMPQRLDYDNERDIKDYLKDVFNGIVEKDICNDRSKINKETFLAVCNYVIANVGKEFSPSSIVSYYNKQNGNDEIFKENVYRYLEKMEEACLINRVKRFDIPSKRTLKKIEKHYAIDNGLLLACSDSNQMFVSRALENAIYNELIYRGFDVKIGKTYKGEIDFVAMKDDKKCFIQVVYMLANQDVIDREFDAFSSIKDHSPKYVFSLDDFDMSKDGIKHINVEDFLVGAKNIDIG